MSPCGFDCSVGHDLFYCGECVRCAQLRGKPRSGTMEADLSAPSLLCFLSISTRCPPYCFSLALLIRDIFALLA